MELLLAFIVALAITLALMPALIKLAGRWRMVDIPDVRKVHVVGVPRVGGIGMVIGVIVAALLWMPATTQLTAVLAAVAVLMSFGMIDDKYQLNYKWKFLGQFLSATIAVVYGGIIIKFVPFMGMDPIPSYVGIPLTIIALVGAINAVNLSDGLDGLAGGIVLLSLAAILVLAMKSDSVFVVALCIIVMAVIFGFLRFNTHPAIVFMGDTGSQFLGFVTALLALYLTQISNAALNPGLPLLLVGVPILDTLLVMTKRIRMRKSPFSPDKNHMHHRLLSVGFAHYEAVFLIYIVQATFVITAMLVRYESDAVVVGVYLVLAALLTVALMKIEGVRSIQNASFISGGLTEMISKIDAAMVRGRIPVRILNATLLVFLISAPISASHVSSDVALTASVTGLLLIFRLSMGMRAAYIPLRFLMYVVVALCAYLAEHRDSPSELAESASSVFMMVVVGLMIIFAVLAMRYDKSGAFKTTPTDFLVLGITITLGFVSKNSGFPEEFGRIIVLLVISFYATEIALRNMRTRWNVMTIGAVGAVCIIAAKSFYPEWFI